MLHRKDTAGLGGKTVTPEQVHARRLNGPPGVQTDRSEANEYFVSF